MDVKGPDRRQNETRRARPDDNEEPFSGLAFKLMTDPYVGQLTFVRVYSASLKSGDTGLQPDDGRERIGRILQMHANQPA